MEIQAVKRLQSFADPQKVSLFEKYFDTKMGDHDVFLGVKVPHIHQVAEEFHDMDLRTLKKLLISPVHEARLLALDILADGFAKKDAKIQKTIITLYLAHTHFVNNWDLVDGSAPKILGIYLLDKPRDILYKLAQSSYIWEKRIALIATFAFIKHDDVTDALALCKMLLPETNSYIHKAIGWVLREIGKHNVQVLITFLRDEYERLPRITLRYAIERFPQEQRKQFLHGRFI